MTARALYQKPIEQLEELLEEKTEQYRYLYAKRRGAWGIPTDADSRRYSELRVIRDVINSKRKEQNL